MQLGVRLCVKGFIRLVAAVFLYFTDTSSMKLSGNVLILSKLKCWHPPMLVKVVILL